MVKFIIRKKTPVVRTLIFCILSSFLILSCDSDSPMDSEMLLQEEPQFSLEEPTPDLEEPPLYLNEAGNEAQIVISGNFEKEAISLRYKNKVFLEQYYTIKFAADLLQKYFEKVTGTKLEIVTDDNFNPKRPQIALGGSKFNAHLDDERNALPPEGFIIRRNGNKISIAGQLSPRILVAYNPEFDEGPLIDTGVIFGTVEFIERVLGVRWYFPGELGTVIPKKEKVSFNESVIKDAPFYKQRTIHYNTVFLKAGEYESYLEVKNYGFRLGDSTGFNMVHTDDFCELEDKALIEKFNEIKSDEEGKEVDIRAKDQNGNLVIWGNNCYRLNYSDPKTIEFQIQRIRDFFNKGTRIGDYGSLSWPNKKYAKFWPADLEDVYHDETPASKALWIDVGKYPEYEFSGLSNYIFNFVALFADALKNSEYSSLNLAFAAYNGYILPPNGIKIPENAHVTVTTLKGNGALVSEYYFDYTKDLITKWWEYLGKDPNRVYLWEYSGLYPYLPLNLFPHRMQEWYRFTRDKVTGSFIEGDIWQRGAMRRNILNHWLRSKLWWNPDADVDKLISQYCKDLFGNGAKAMEEVFKRTTTQHEQEIAKYWTGPSPIHVAIPADLALSETYLKNICPKMYPQPFFDEVNKFFKEARDAVGPNSIQMKRIDFFQGGYTELEEMCKQGKVLDLFKGEIE